MNNIAIILVSLLLASSNAFHGFPRPSARKLVKNETQITLKSCGVAKNTFQDGDRIVGGRDALYGEFPWQVSLQYKSLFIRPTHICGAAILNKRWIITAAHCVYGRFSFNYEVAVGVYELDKKENYVASYEVAEIIAHKDFERETFRNDIALLKLKKPISFARSKGYINGICLAGRNQTPTGFGIATGWGSTMEGGDVSNVLQAVKLPIVPRNICEIIFGEGAITQDMLCAGEPQGGLDTCQGDSGGPLIQKDSTGRNVLIGIVSWGVGCARPGLPGIYTSVPYFIDWITANMK